MCLPLNSFECVRAWAESHSFLSFFLSLVSLVALVALVVLAITCIHLWLPVKSCIHR